MRMRDHRAWHPRHHLFTCQTARSRRRLHLASKVKPGSSPVLLLGAGVRPSSSLFLPPHVEGDGAPTRRSARMAPGDVRLRPDHGAKRRTRASRRANAVSSARAYQRANPAGRNPGRFRAPPVGWICVNRRPAGAAPAPRLANASGRRPSQTERDSGSMAIFHQMSINIFAV
jgi:hypothetical protein